MALFDFLKPNREMTVDAALNEVSPEGSTETVSDKPDYSQERLERLNTRLETVRTQLTGRSMLDHALHPQLMSEAKRIEQEIEACKLGMQAALWLEGEPDRSGGAPTQPVVSRLPQEKES